MLEALLLSLLLAFLLVVGMGSAVAGSATCSVSVFSPDDSFDWQMAASGIGSVE